MRIEHVAMNLPEPVRAAQWYVEHLGMKIVRDLSDTNQCYFLADSSGQTVLEIYRNPAGLVPDYPNQSHLTLHLAFVSADPTADAERLQQAGASFVEAIGPNDSGDHLIMLRDPWGVPIQLAKRGQPMV